MNPSPFRQAVYTLARMANILVFCLAAVIPKASAKSPIEICTTWFTNIRESLFMHRNYVRNVEGFHVRTAEEFNRAWIRATIFDLRVNQRFLQQSIADKHPQIAFLERLGFKFKADGTHQIPSMDEIAKNYEGMLSSLVQNEKIASTETLRPARMFRTLADGKLKLIAVPLERDPPFGAHAVNDVLSGEEFLRFVAEGHWPMGEIMIGGDTNISFALHDLGHFGAFIANPEFMAALRSFAQRRVAEGRFAIDDSKLNLILESLALGRHDNRPKFLETSARLTHLTTESAAALPPKSASTYENYLKSLPPETLDREVRVAYSKRHEMVQDIGGARNDAISAARARAKAGARPFISIRENPKSLLEEAYDAKDPEQRRSLFARYLSAMDHTTRMNPADWLRELTDADKLSKNSPTYGYLCSSGVFPYKGRFYQTFCRD